MSSVSLHPTPARAAVAIEQFRAVGLSVRWVWLMVTPFVAFITLIVSDTTGQVSPAVFVPAAVSVLAAGVAVFIAQVMWRHEAPAQRGYLYSLPVARASTQLLKNGAGWAWTMIGTAAVYLWALVVIVPIGNLRIVSLAPWQWAAPFVAATIAFLFLAALATVSRYVSLFFIGLYFAGMALVRTQPGMNLLGTGRYSLAIVGSGSPTDPMLERWTEAAPLGDWLVGSALWLGAGLVLLYLASRLRRDV